MVQVESKSLVNAICDGFDISGYCYIKTKAISKLRVFAKVLEDGHAIVCVNHDVFILEPNEYEIEE